MFGGGSSPHASGWFCEMSETLETWIAQFATLQNRKSQRAKAPDLTGFVRPPTVPRHGPHEWFALQLDL